MNEQEIDMQRDAKRHIVITGTGRAGTTLLVRILADVGLETGFREKHFSTAEGNTGRAGLERRITPKNIASLPLVVKSPRLVEDLAEVLDTGVFRIGLAIVPIRALEKAAASRVAAAERHAAAGGDFKNAPGGLWKTDDPDRQEEALALQFYRIVEILKTHEIPTAFPMFPRFVTDFAHFDRTVGGYLLERFGVSRKTLRQAWTAQCKPELITQF